MFRRSLVSNFKSVVRELVLSKSTAQLLGVGAGNTGLHWNSSSININTKRRWKKVTQKFTTECEVLKNIRIGLIVRKGHSQMGKS